MFKKSSIYKRFEQEMAEEEENDESAIDKKLAEMKTKVSAEEALVTEENKKIQDKADQEKAQ